EEEVDQCESCGHQAEHAVVEEAKAADHQKDSTNQKQRTADRARRAGGQGDHKQQGGANEVNDIDEDVDVEYRQQVFSLDEQSDQAMTAQDDGEHQCVQLPHIGCVPFPLCLFVRDLPSYAKEDERVLPRH